MSDLPDSTQPDTSELDNTEPDPSASNTDVASPDDEDGAALRRSAESIREAREAEGGVAASDDITTLDEDRAGEYSEDPDGEGGHP
jgi:hypothetical protein